MIKRLSGKIQQTMSSSVLSVSVVIPNFNGQDLLKKNLPSVIKAYKNKRNSIKEIIVVDDGSKDGSVKFIKDNFPEVKIVKHTKNRGFPAAVNTGSRTAKSTLVCLMNTDVVPSSDFLESTLSHFEHKNVFAVSLNEKGFSWAKGTFKNGFVLHSPGRESEKNHDTFWVSGGSGVFRRSMWMKLKGMDEKLYSPYYWEDLDLGYRAAKRGWKLLWEPKAKVVHEHEKTMSKINKNYRARIQERNQLLFVWKNITSFVLIKKHIRGLARRVARHPGYLRIVVMAFLRLRFVRAARRVEKKESKVSDESIFAKFQNA